MKILFNICVHQNNDVAHDMIDNINRFVKNPTMVLHVSQVFRDFDLDGVRRKDNVIINDLRFKFDRLMATRQGSRVKAFLSSAEYAKNQGVNYDYEMLFYPKMLFCKHGIEDYLNCGADAFLNVKPSERPMAWGGKRYDSLLEGITMSRKVADSVYSVIKACPHLLHADGHCPEEVILPTLIKVFAAREQGLPILMRGSDAEGNDLNMLKEVLHDKCTEDVTGNGWKETWQPSIRRCSEIFILKNCGYDVNSLIRQEIRKMQIAAKDS